MRREHVPDQGCGRSSGVSDDTVRRWVDIGRIPTTTDTSGRLVIDGAVLARFAEEIGGASSGAPNQVVVSESVRNRFTGLVTRVVRDTVMAQVEIQSGPHRFRLVVEPGGGGRSGPRAGSAGRSCRQGDQRFGGDTPRSLTR
jgi:hypothetical protein